MEAFKIVKDCLIDLSFFYSGSPPVLPDCRFSSNTVFSSGLLDVIFSLSSFIWSTALLMRQSSSRHTTFTTYCFSSGTTENLTFRSYLVTCTNLNTIFMLFFCLSTFFWELSRCIVHSSCDDTLFFTVVGKC